jgi:ABC-type transport system involved in multi-copper enzyme maturation permease subunit
MGAVYWLTLRQVSGRWRLLSMAVLATLPIIMTLLTLQGTAPPVQEYETFVLGGMLAGSIVPLVVLAIGAPAFANEIEDRTLANLVLSPLARWQIALPKLLATLTLAMPFTAASALVTGHAAFLGDWTATLAVTAAALLCVALYAAAFVWLGLVTTQAIGVGLLYIVLWEGFFAEFVTGVRLLSIRYHAIALMHGLDPRRFADHEHPALATVLATSAVVFGGFLWLSIRRLRRMDIP